MKDKKIVYGNNLIKWSHFPLTIKCFIIKYNLHYTIEIFYYATINKQRFIISYKLLPSVYVTSLL